jgi:hypothetical protein
MGASIAQASDLQEMTGELLAATATTKRLDWHSLCTSGATTSIVECSGLGRGLEGKETKMLATRSIPPAHRRAVPTPAEIRFAAAAIRRQWTPQERVLRQYVADLRRQSLLRGVCSAA